MTPFVGAPCPCGGTFSRAERYERTRTVSTVICWDCALEYPPLYVRDLAVFDISPKWCTGCKQDRPRSRFATNHKHRDRLQTWCIDCNHTRRIPCPVCGEAFRPRPIAPGRRQQTCSQDCRAESLRGTTYRVSVRVAS